MSSNTNIPRTYSCKEVYSRLGFKSEAQMKRIMVSARIIQASGKPYARCKDWFSHVIVEHEHDGSCNRVLRINSFGATKMWEDRKRLQNIQHGKALISKLAFL